MPRVYVADTDKHSGIHPAELMVQAPFLTGLQITFQHCIGIFEFLVLIEKIVILFVRSLITSVSCLLVSS